MGRHRTPKALNELRGNPGKRPLNDAEPQFASLDQQPPAYLDEVGAEKWRERVECLSSVPGLISQNDYDALAAYCEAYQEFRAALEEIEQDGPTAVSHNGAAYAHPAVGRKNQAVKRMLSIGSKFGMNPSDRQRLSAGGVEDTDPLLAMMRQRGTN